MNWIDILVLIPLAWFAFRGLKNGLIMEVASLVAIIGGGWLTVRYAPVIAAKLGGSLTVEIVTFIVFFFFILLSVHYIAVFISKIVKLVIPGWVDHIFGALFGAVKVILVFGILFMFLFKIDEHSIVIKQDTKEKSFFCSKVEPVVAKLYGNTVSKIYETQKDCSKS